MLGLLIVPLSEIKSYVVVLSFYILHKNDETKNSSGLDPLVKYDFAITM